MFCCFFHFQFVEQVLETKISNGVSSNPDLPAHPDAHLEIHRKKAVTPLDMNRFQSRAFRAVISQQRGQDPTFPPVRQPLTKEPSLHLDTPSKFLSKDKLFKPSFDVTVRFEGNVTSANGFMVYKGRAPNCALLLKFVIESHPEMLINGRSELR